MTNNSVLTVTKFTNTYYVIASCPASSSPVDSAELEKVKLMQKEKGHE